VPTSRDTGSVNPACAECGLDPELLSIPAAADMIEEFGPRFVAVFESVAMDPARLCAKPDPDVWSPLEYAVHMRELIRYHGWLANRALTEDRPEVPAPNPDSVAEGERYNEADPGDVLAGITRQSLRFADRARGMTEVELDRLVVRAGTDTRVRHMIRNVAHEGHHHLQDVQRLLA
jgi:hypothetical protein